MYKLATVRVLSATSLRALMLALLVAAVTLQAQSSWRPIGNTLIDRSLAGLATGPVDRVWYSTDGSQLLIRTAPGTVFSTSDFETWQRGSATPQAPASRSAATLPETSAVTRTARTNSPRLYSFAKFVYKSDNNGASWDNLTAFRNTS